MKCRHCKHFLWMSLLLLQLGISRAAEADADLQVGILSIEYHRDCNVICSGNLEMNFHAGRSNCEQATKSNLRRLRKFRRPLFPTSDARKFVNINVVIHIPDMRWGNFTFARYEDVPMEKKRAYLHLNTFAKLYSHAPAFDFIPLSSEIGLPSAKIWTNSARYNCARENKSARCKMMLFQAGDFFALPLIKLRRFRHCDSVSEFARLIFIGLQ